MRGRGSAATTDNVDAKVIGKVDDLICKSLGRLIVVHLAVDY